MKRLRVWVIAAAVATMGGCAVRMGGPSPVGEDALILRITNETADQIATMLKQDGVEFAILSGSRDSAFYADVATRAGMKSTRPGRAGTTTFAFLGPQALGDTTLSLKVQGGGEIRIHDALYRIDKERRLDLMAVHFESATNIKEHVRTLLNYVSTDVSASAGVILSVESPTPALGDSVSVLLRAYLADVWECTKEGKAGARNQNLPMRAYYGPSARIRCDDARLLTNAGGGMFGHFVMLR
ncbi:MAG TPA: hypothetical protein VM100_04600 [Longimicrobiales bacterium]|nr:hypothetical protein [Longimicrobiales bacterium]